MRSDNTVRASLRFPLVSCFHVSPAPHQDGVNTGARPFSAVPFRKHLVPFGEHSVPLREYSVPFKEHSVPSREHSETKRSRLLRKKGIACRVSKRAYARAIVEFKGTG